MRRLSVPGLVALAVAACGALLLVLVLRVVLGLMAAPGPQDAAVLAIDAVVLGAGVLGLMVFVGAHVQQAVMGPLKETTRRADEMAAAQAALRVPEEGPREVRELAAAVNRLTDAWMARERRLLHEAGVQATHGVLAGVAHELRNPLASLRLRWQAEGSTEGVRAVDRVEEVVAILQEVASARPECDVNRVARASLIAAHQEMVLDVLIETDLQAQRRGACNGGQLAQALAAVVRNAAEAMQGHGRLRVATWDEDGFVAIEVQDTGPGIPDAVRATLFEAFTTSKPGHAGLGLPLAQRILEACGGDLDVSSTPGGARVRLRVPASSISTPSPAPVPDGTGAGGG